MRLRMLLAAFAMPLQALSPGDAVHVSQQELCTPGYSKSVRHVSQSTKKRVCKAYGKKDQCPEGYEIDHIIPLALGGSNSEKNLWPQPWAEAREKDVVENALHKQVCRGTISLSDAQRIVLSKWPDYLKQFRGKK